MATPDLGHSRQQIARNFIMGALALVITIAVGVFYTPFMLRRLGPAVYGLVPLVSSVTNYFTIITVSVAGMVGRNITSELARGDLQRANQQFNTFFRVGLLMSGTLFGLGLIFAFFLPRVFNIPPGQERATQVLFVCIAFALLLSVVGSTFESTIWARNRLDVRSGLDVASLVMRAGIVVALFSWFQPALWAVSVAAVTTAIIGFSANAVASYKLMPAMWLRRGAPMDPEALKGIWFTSRWLFVNQLGTLLLMNVDLILINVLLGPAQVGQYAPLVQWVTILRTGIGAVTNVLGPPMVALYARGEFEALTSISARSLKLIALIVALPAGILVGLSQPILNVWLGAEFAPPAALTWVMLTPLLVEATTGPLFLIGLAADKVRPWALATVGAGLACIPIAWILVRVLHWDLFGVAAAAAVVSLVRCGIFSSVFTAALLRQRWKDYFGIPIASALVFFLLEAGGATLVARGFTPRTLPQIAAAAAAVGLVAAGLAWVAILSSGDRAKLMQLVRGSVDRQ